MDSAALTAAQLNALATRAARHLRYLRHLRDRVAACHFPDDDPLAIAVRRAADGADLLYRTAADLEQAALVADARSKRQASMIRRHPPRH